MRRLTFPHILIVFYGVAVAAALLIYFLTGRNLPIREIILALTFLFLLLYRIHFFLSPHSAAEQSPEQNTRTRRINPRLGWLGLLGLLGILGFFTGEGFLFLFFWFFGFFGFFYEGKLSNTLRDERFILNQQRACSHRRPAPFPLLFDGHAGAEPGRHQLFAALPAVPLRPVGGLRDGDISL